jgi:hypothetical protein
MVQRLVCRLILGQGRRVRTVIESDQKTQSQRDYLPSLDLSTNQAKQQSTTQHIGTHILSESNKDNAQTHYQLNSHLQSNILELNDKAQTLSYESADSIALIIVNIVFYSVAFV